MISLTFYNCCIFNWRRILRTCHVSCKLAQFPKLYSSFIYILICKIANISICNFSQSFSSYIFTLYFFHHAVIVSILCLRNSRRFQEFLNKTAIHLLIRSYIHLHIYLCISMYLSLSRSFLSHSQNEIGRKHNRKGRTICIPQTSTYLRLVIPIKRKNNEMGWQTRRYVYLLTFAETGNSSVGKQFD